MGFWSSFFPKKKVPNYFPLRFTDRAMIRFATEQKKNPNILSLSIQIRDNRENLPVLQIGFSEEPGNSEFRIPIVTGHRVLERIEGGELDYGEEERQFLFFPDIVLDWEDTPRKNLFRIKTNKKLVKEGISFAGLKGDITNYATFTKILDHPKVLSIYVSEFYIQVELESFSQSIEEEISDLILMGLSRLPLPWEG